MNYSVRHFFWQLGVVTLISFSATSLWAQVLNAPRQLSKRITALKYVRLAWVDTNNENDKRFAIERRLGSTGTFQQIATIAAEQLSYVDKTTKAGTTYSYRVRTLQSNVYSGYSNTVTVKLPATATANSAPVVTNPSNQSRQEGTAISLQIVATDANQDALSYSATNLPAGLSMNTSTGQISGTLAAGSARATAYAITVSVSDGKATTSVNFNFQVTAATTTPPPASAGVLMYSYDANLSNGRALNGATLERQLVYFYISNASLYRSVNFYCCKGMAGAAAGEGHLAAVLDQSAPFSHSVDLAQLKGGTRELYVDAMKVGATIYDSISTNFILKDAVSTTPNPPTTPTPLGTISQKYPNDAGIANDPAVLFHSGFENDMNGWSSYSTSRINGEALVTVVNNASGANGGNKFMQSRITRSQLAVQQYISAQAQINLPQGAPTLYARYYAKIVGQTARPHHWVRFGAGGYSDGLANNVPPGDQGFWYDLDINSDGKLNFYMYWHQMRSGRCNNGTAVPGCAGDQGTTYYYGNTFYPAGQSALPRDQWICIETMTKANTVGTSDGAVAAWVNNQLIGEYKPGTPIGNYLRDNFFTHGQYFNASTAQPFGGFNFRTSNTVLPKRLTLDMYYERGTIPASAPETQIIQYDDVVLATQRIGCK